MFDAVEWIHRALGIQSTWLFVLTIALLAALLAALAGGATAWVVDRAYRNSSEYKAAPPDPKSPAGASMMAQTTTATQQVTPAPQPTPPTAQTGTQTPSHQKTTSSSPKKGSMQPPTATSGNSLQFKAGDGRPPAAFTFGSPSQTSPQDDRYRPGLSDLTVDTNGIRGAVGVACFEKHCDLSGVEIKGYGNGGTGVLSSNGLKARNLTMTPGESPDNQSSEPIQLFDSSTGKTSNHKLDVNRRSEDMTQQQVMDAAVAAIRHFVSTHRRMPNNQELTDELGEQSKNMWVNIDCEGHGVGIANTGNSSFEDVTINQTSCDTGINNSANAATFKGVRITISSDKK